MEELLMPTWRLKRQKEQVPDSQQGQRPLPHGLKGRSDKGTSRHELHQSHRTEPQIREPGTVFTGGHTSLKAPPRPCGWFACVSCLFMFPSKGRWNRQGACLLGPLVPTFYTLHQQKGYGEMIQFSANILSSGKLRHRKETGIGPKITMCPL